MDITMDQDIFNLFKILLKVVEIYEKEKNNNY